MKNLQEKRAKVCLDFDGVLATYDGKWKGEHYLGKPLPGLKKFLERLTNGDIDVIVLTTRKSKKLIFDWFKKNKLPPPSSITNKKIRADVYVDDHAVYFDGNFEHLIKTLAKFRVHYKKERPLKALSKPD